MKSNPKKLTEDNNHTLEEEQTKHKTLKIKQLETARLQTIGNSTIEYNSSNLKRRQNNALTLTNINIRNNSYNFKCRKERCNNWNLPDKIILLYKIDYKNIKIYIDHNLNNPSNPSNPSNRKCTEDHPPDMKDMKDKKLILVAVLTIGNVVKTIVALQ